MEYRFIRISKRCSLTVSVLCWTKFDVNAIDENYRTLPTELKQVFQWHLYLPCESWNNSRIVKGHLHIFGRRNEEKNERWIDLIWNCFISDIYKVFKSFQSKTKTILKVNYSMQIWLWKKDNIPLDFYNGHSTLGNQDRKGFPRVVWRIRFM